MCVGAAGVGASSVAKGQEVPNVFDHCGGVSSDVGPHDLANLCQPCTDVPRI